MPKWHPYLPRTFLFCLSLQAGVVACSVSGLTIMLITTLVNIYAPNGERETVQAVQYILLFLYLLVMFSAFTMAFLAAFWEISKFLKYAACLMLFGLFLYVLYAILSIIPNYDTMINVCPGRRCPDHHWLHSDHWRDIVMQDDEEDKPRSTKDDDANGSFLESTPSSLRQNRRRNQLTTLVNNPVENWVRLKRNDAIGGSNGVATDTELITEPSTENDTIVSQGVGPVGESNGGRTTRRPKGQQKSKDSRADAMYIILSVFYILLFIGFLGYSMLIFLAFSRELDVY